MPELTVNGERREYADADFPPTVLALVTTFSLDPATVVAEVDGEIVPRAAFADHALSAGARVELVHFVGGG